MAENPKTKRAPKPAIVSQTHLDCYLHVTRKCNQLCAFCSTPPIGKELSKIQLESKILVLKERIAFQGGGGQVVFSGGEPTLSPDLPGLIGFAKSHGLETKLISNGILLSDSKLAQTLANAGLDRAAISLHSHREKASDEITGIAGAYKKTLAGIRNAHEAGIQVSLGIVVNALNCEELEDYAEFVAKEFPFAKFISINFTDPVQRAKKNRWVVPRLWRAEPHLYKMMNSFEKKGVDFHCERVPLCYLFGYEQHSSESTTLMGADRQVMARIDELENNALHTMDKSRDYVNAPQCKLCSLEKICAGLDSHYAQMFGTGELFPQFHELDARKNLWA